MIDFCNTEDALFLEHDIDLVIQEIDMLFDTMRGEVLGNYLYGSEFYKFLYDLNASDSYIENYVTTLINTHCNLHGFKLDVKVTTHMGTENDIILIRINLKKNGDIWQKIYNIS